MAKLNYFIGKFQNAQKRIKYQSYKIIKVIVIRDHVKLFIVNVCSLLAISGIRECLVLLCNRTWEARGFVSS